MDQHTERAKTFFHGALALLAKGVRELWALAMSHKKIAFSIFCLAAVGVIALAFILPTPKEAPSDERPQVSLLRVGDAAAGEPITLIGSIHSTSEAQVAPDVSGQITGLYHNIGDYVAAGTIIAEIKNDSQRAAVSQAKAALLKVENSTGVSQISLSSSQDTFQIAQQNAATTIESAYATIADTVLRQTDQMFTNPNSTNPTLTAFSSNSQAKLDAESDRLKLQQLLNREQSATIPTTYSDELVELATAGNEAAQVAAFLQDLSAALNSAVPSSAVDSTTITSYRSTVNTALSTINTLRTTLASTLNTLKADRAAVASGEENLSTGGAAVTPDVAAAQASLDAAQAQLEHTIIRAPIAGTINRLDLNVGSFVNPGTPVLYITNPHGLEVQSFLSERDISLVHVGSVARIGGVATGTVTRVAAALDPVTRKAEIKIALPEGAPLVAGQSATVEIPRSIPRGLAAQLFSIPIAAVKITPDGAVVFTTTASSTLEAHPVVLGTLHGALVDIPSGVDADMHIVADARGLTDGEAVLVK